MGDIVLYRGSLFQVINRKEIVNLKLNNKEYSVALDYELIKRPPGVRALIVNNGKILLNKEFRYELNNWDFRLPGGKVFDSQEEYELALSQNTIDKHAEKKLHEELMEEAEIIVKKYKFLEISHCGFTVEWDLYYYIVDEFEESELFNKNVIQKNQYEFIEHCWIDYSTAFKYCMDKRITEERSSNVLMRYLMTKLKNDR